MAQANDRLPAMIGGYRVVRRLVREATVDTLLARRETPRGDGPPVVLKLVTPPFRSDAAFDQTFARETQLLAGLDNPCIVRLADVFTGPDLKAMVFEHVDGVSLAQLRAALSQRGEVLTDPAIFAIAAAVFSALAAAHAARDPQTGNLLPVVHRDVHPAQILISRAGDVKVAGFGLERITGVRGDARAPEARAYLPPEKARGESVTIRSDVYAAMLIIWELLTRRRAIRDDALPERELMRALAQPTIVSLEVLRPELPPLVRGVVGRGLEPQVERRSVTAEEVASIFRMASPGEEGRQALADAVARIDGVASTAAPPASSSAPPADLPRFPLESGLDAETAPAAGPERRGAPQPPRPAPRRMWASSPTLTPASGISPPSSRMGSIPDARFAQDPGRIGQPPASAPPGSVQTAPVSSPMPPSSKAPPKPAFGKSTMMGGFDEASLKPLTAGGTPIAASPRPGDVITMSPPSAILDATPAPPRGSEPASAPPSGIPEPPASLPGMGVPLALAPTMMGDAPAPVFNDSARPPEPGSVPPRGLPPAPNVSPLWVPANVPAASAQHNPRSQATISVRPAGLPGSGASSSLLALGVGLFLIAAAVGAAVFVVLSRKPIETRPVASASASASPKASTAIASTPSRPTASVAPSASAPAATTTPTAPPKAASSVPVVAASALPSAKAPAPTPAPAPEPAPTPTPAPNPSAGLIRVDKRAANHRVFIDGKIVGEGEGPYEVSCGVTHSVKVGSRGRVQKIDVGCGAEVNVKLQ